MASSTSKWGIPPIEKIHEAFSAVVDNRVEITGNTALVSSSDGKKQYTITWDGDAYTSNDNASYWQGYLGYPVIAVLMIQGKLDYNKEVAAHFAGINWKQLNTQCKNKYDKVVATILSDFASQNIDVNEINTEVDKVYMQIKNLNLIYIKSKLQPPK